MEKRVYHIATLPAGTAADCVDWSAIPAAPIDTYRWLEDYAPKAFARLVFVEDYGFILRMTCEEREPKAVYHNYNEPVYTDSCMEYFCDWLNDGRYLNMEMNSLGTLLSCMGADRVARTPSRDLMGGEIFPVKGEVFEDFWQVTAEMPLSLLRKLLGCDALPFGKGYAFTGNFYKCGDETAAEHYGMWNYVGTETPDFHRPEFFGALVMD